MRHGAGEPVRYRQCFALIRFECDLLSEHDITGDEVDVRDKAPTDAGNTGIVEFIYVRGYAVTNPVFLSAVATSDVEVSFCIKLRALLRR